MSGMAPENIPGQDNGEGSQGFQQPTETTATPNINPAWNDALGVIPSQLHSQVLPHFQKWDQNFQSQIQKVHSQYEPYKPFIEQGISPEDINFGVGLMNALSQNPQEVLSALQEWMQAENGSPEQQGQYGSTPQFDPNDLTQNPKYQEMESAVQSMAQILLEQKQQEQQMEADQALETDLNSLLEEFKDRGPFDENYVLGVAMAGDNFNYDGLRAAVEQFYQMRDGLLQQSRKPGPPVLGTGGAIPNTNVETRNLDSASTKNLVAQMLQQAAQQGQ